MAAVNSTTNTSSPPPTRRLLFDRRYGWVFCIVPLAKAVLKKASESVNFIASSTVHVLERPELLSPKVIQATVSDQMHKIASSVKNSELFVMAPKTNVNKSESTSSSSDLPEENSGSV
ncbi:hypothetical protein BUALT_Bualt08G0147700 [Buddleja alternifolia]|uniref:Uncharacterized protein n=1 Tax=Buddleja alternifolia TaxID=168488 RepID=A0AAV6XDH4_9LAMI|nr:hypothetical protein BUALT_Bualt08G0147700 [Buddleja alternifolia]